MTKARVHLEELIDERDINYLLCPDCDGRLYVKSFGAGYDRGNKVLACTKCPSRWNVRIKEILLKTTKMKPSIAKRF